MSMHISALHLWMQALYSGSSYGITTIHDGVHRWQVQTNNYWWFVAYFSLSRSDSGTPEHFSAGLEPQPVQSDHGPVCGAHLLLLHAERVPHTAHQPAQQDQRTQRRRMELRVSTADFKLFQNMDL